MVSLSLSLSQFNSCSCRRLSPNHSSYSPQPQLSGVHFKLCLCTLLPRTPLLLFLYFSLRHNGKHDRSEHGPWFFIAAWLLCHLTAPASNRALIKSICSYMKRIIWKLESFLRNHEKVHSSFLAQSRHFSLSWEVYFQHVTKRCFFFFWYPCMIIITEVRSCQFRRIQQ